MNKLARVIAFYLPQYHPIPENDEWWGEGFTEWTNVMKAKPLFRGHYQPRIPAELGYYDLRVPETRAAQAELAKNYGIEAFCYYHYWFGGRRLLERPFNEIMETGEPDFPFCLCWANQTWTGIWHGQPDRILMEQTYPGMDDHRAHFAFLLRALTDDRYITIEGKPLLLIYRPMDIPDVRRVTDLWRELALKSGLNGLHLAGVHEDTDWMPQQFGFDSSTTPGLPNLIKWRTQWISRRHPFKKLTRLHRKVTNKPAIYNYKDEVLNMIRENTNGAENHPCLIPNWDNTPRSGANGLVLHESTPELFRVQIQKALRLTRDKPLERKVIFIKAWNEWAEGNYLEPDMQFGRRYLDALRSEIFVRHKD